MEMNEIIRTYWPVGVSVTGLIFTMIYSIILEKTNRDERIWR